MRKVLISTVVVLVSVSATYALQQEPGVPIATGFGSRSVVKFTEEEKRDYEQTRQTIQNLKIRGQKFRRDKNYDLAIKTYEEIIPLMKSKWWYYKDVHREQTWMAECYLLKGDEKNSAEFYRRAIREGIEGRTVIGNPPQYINGTNTAYNNGADWFAYATLLSKLGKYEEAQTLYNYGLITLRAQTYSFFVPNSLTGNEGKARQEAMMSLAAGIAYCDMEMYDCASNFLEPAIKKLPDSALANYYYGQLWEAHYNRDKVPYANRDKVKTAYTRAAELGRGELKVAAEGLLSNLKDATQLEYAKANAKPSAPPKQEVQPVSSSFPVTPGLPAPVGTPAPPKKP